MGKLAEYVRTEAEHLRGELSRREGERDRWRAAIDRLNRQIVDWVAAADGGNRLLEANPTVELTRQESIIGVYTVRGVTITLGGRFSGRSADVVPRARYVAARVQPPGEAPRRADGLVEIKSGSSPEYYLFRVAGDGPDSDRWFIRDANVWDSSPGDYAVEPLDQDRFEEALLRVLR
jgi:hypothetical protein